MCVLFYLQLHFLSFYFYLSPSVAAYSVVSLFFFLLYLLSIAIALVASLSISFFSILLSHNLHGSIAGLVASLSFLFIFLYL